MKPPYLKMDKSPAYQIGGWSVITVKTGTKSRLAEIKTDRDSWDSVVAALVNFYIKLSPFQKSREGEKKFADRIIGVLESMSAGGDEEMIAFHDENNKDMDEDDYDDNQ